jgi:hypothetical protein
MAGGISAIPERWVGDYMFGQLGFIPSELPGVGAVDGEALVDGDALVDGVGLVSGAGLADGDVAAWATANVPYPPAMPMPSAMTNLTTRLRVHARLFIA